MDLRRESFEVLSRDLGPFLIEAIKRHPNPVDFRVLRGNVVTVRDYTRRMIISARRHGIGKYTAEQVLALKPRLGVYYSSGGICITAIHAKYMKRMQWDNYSIPFSVAEEKDARWTSLAVNPSEAEISSLADLLSRRVLEYPVEIRTPFTLLQVKKIVNDRKVDNVHVFKFGRNVMLFPRIVECLQSLTPKT